MAHATLTLTKICTPTVSEWKDNTLALLVDSHVLFNFVDWSRLYITLLSFPLFPKRQTRPTPF